MYNTNPKLIVITGPTGIGKTSFAIRIAQKLHCPIVSADSRQVFIEMPIGTSAPTENEQLSVPHYMVGVRSVHEPYSVSDYEHDVLPLLKKLFNECQYVVLTGGSMLYVDAITKGFDDIPPTKPEVRIYLTERVKTEGLSSILQQLKQIDPIYYNTVDKNNAKRVIRGLEVYLSTGKPFSSFRKGELKRRPFSVQKVLLEKPRNLLYESINTRTRIMIRNGWLLEALPLFPYRELNALNTIGYKELFSFFIEVIHCLGYEIPFSNTSIPPELFTELSGLCKAIQTENFATIPQPIIEAFFHTIEQIQSNTRNYARKQIIYFRKDDSSISFSPLGKIEKLFPALGIHSL